ncbi:hypothetical protein LCGC14_2646430 [marine sediment metagenome]|uniref:Uncharacterized protein n=1 Tax=marine sediment metagenome TaxID=412755 RepID=A0A0F9C6I8_9ZZZZ
MSANGTVSISMVQEALKEYIPQAFLDAEGSIAKRIYTHAYCSKSASYQTFELSKDENGFICPMCSSRENRVTPNIELNAVISGFIKNFNLRNSEDTKSSYDLAEHLFKEKKFEYVTKICRRAFGFLSDPVINKKIGTLLKKAEENIAQKQRAHRVQKESVVLESQLDFTKNLNKIQSLENDLNACLERLKSSDNDIEISCLKSFVEIYFREIANEKKFIALIYFDNHMHLRAIDTFEEAINVYKNCLELDIEDSALRISIFINLASYLAEFGDFFVSLNNFSRAIKKYQESIENLNKAISLCEKESEQKDLLSKLDKCYFKLGSAYRNLADEYSVQKEDFQAIENYNKAKEAIENIKNRENELNELKGKLIS